MQSAPVRQASRLEDFEDVFRLNRVLLWEIDRAGRYVYASPSHEEILGYRPEELVGLQTIHDFYPEDLAPELRAEVSDDWIRQEKEFCDFEVPLRAKDGRLVWIRSSGRALYDEAGQVRGYRGVDVDITVRKDVERKLQLNNEQMRLAAQAGGIGFWLHDYGTGREDWDDGMLRLYGIRREEFVGTDEAWLRSVHPEDRAALAAAVAGSERAGDRARHEFRIVRPDGQLRYLSSEWMVVRDPGGRLIRMVGLNQDITERMAATRQLAESEERFRLMIENSPVAVAYTDRITGRVHFNTAYESLLGYRRDEAWTREELAAAIFDAPLDLTKWDEMKSAARQQKETLRIELTMKARDGSHRDVQLTSIALPGVDFNVLLDRTEEKRVLSRLQETSRRVQKIMENAPVPMAYTMAGGPQISFNKTFSKTYGWTAEDVPSVDAWFAAAYPDPAYRRTVRKLWEADVLRASSADLPLVPRVYRITAKDGAVREVEIHAMQFEGEFFGVFLDLTERNKAERLLREQTERLAHAGRVSTLGQLAASLAHELDQPLGAILHNAEAAELLLQKEQPDFTELMAIVDDILDDNRRAGAVLDRIRAMVRRQSFQTERVEVSVLLDELSTLARRKVFRGEAALEISAEPDLPPFEADPVLLQQALLNLVLNAAEAIGPHPAGRIVVRVGQSDENAIEFTVSDNGGGVPAADYANLFVPFYSTKKDGLGMGLPLVSTIVEQHAGQLRVDNQPGRGLTVSIRLPVWRREVGT